MTAKDEELLARDRALVIMKVRSGQITAREGARQLGVSPKTYYEWEKKALASMMESLTNGESGRPSTPEDPEREQLQNRIRDLEKKLLVAEQTVEVKEMLQAYQERQRELDAKKKRKLRKKR